MLLCISDPPRECEFLENKTSSSILQSNLSPIPNTKRQSVNVIRLNHGVFLGLAWQNLVIWKVFKKFMESKYENTAWAPKFFWEKKLVLFPFSRDPLGGPLVHSSVHLYPRIAVMVDSEALAVWSLVSSQGRMTQTTPLSSLNSSLAQPSPQPATPPEAVPSCQHTPPFLIQSVSSPACLLSWT